MSDLGKKGWVGLFCLLAISVNGLRAVAVRKVDQRSVKHRRGVCHIKEGKSRRRVVRNAKSKRKNIESFAVKFCDWAMNNRVKSILLGGLLADSTWRGINEIRLSTIYKKLDEHYECGGCSSSVDKYVFRSCGGEDHISLVVKSISRLSPMGNYFSFSNEQFACKVIPALARENDHLAKIIDYHYGLTHNYVVYEDVGSNYNWKSEMISWGDDKKFKWLEDVITQMVDVNIFLSSKGYYHNDFKLDNLSILKKDDRPFVRIFDYGWFAKDGGTTDVFNLYRFYQQFIRLCCQVIFGEGHIHSYGFFHRLLNIKQLNKNLGIFKENENKLFSKYKDKPLVSALNYLRGNVNTTNPENIFDEFAERRNMLNSTIPSEKFLEILRTFKEILVNSSKTK